MGDKEARCRCNGARHCLARRRRATLAALKSQPRRRCVGCPAPLSHRLAPRQPLPACQHNPTLWARGGAAAVPPGAVGGGARARGPAPLTYIMHAAAAAAVGWLQSCCCDSCSHKYVARALGECVCVCKQGDAGRGGGHTPSVRPSLPPSLVCLYQWWWGGVLVVVVWEGAGQGGCRSRRLSQQHPMCDPRTSSLTDPMSCRQVCSPLGLIPE